MPQVNAIKKHLLVKRAKIMKFLKSEGYTNTEIATIFSIDNSGVTRILSTEKKYKGLVKATLSDTKSRGR